VYANLVLPFTVGLTKAFWEVAAEIPSRLKAWYRLYLRIYERHFPRVLAVPWYSGGIPLNRTGRPSFPQRLYSVLTMLSVLCMVIT